MIGLYVVEMASLHQKLNNLFYYFGALGLTPPVVSGNHRTIGVCRKIGVLVTEGGKGLKMEAVCGSPSSLRVVFAEFSKNYAVEGARKPCSTVGRDGQGLPVPTQLHVFSM